MTEYLIQPSTGMVYVKTDTLAARPDMHPARFDAETDSFVSLSAAEINIPISVSRSAPVVKPAEPEAPKVEVVDQPVATPAPAPEDPLEELTKKEIADLCMEKYGVQIKLVGSTKAFVVAEYRRIEAENEAGNEAATVEIDKE